MLTTAFSLPANLEDGICDFFPGLLQPDEPGNSVPAAENGGELAPCPLLRRVGLSKEQRRASSSELLACVTVETSTTSNSLLEVGTAWVQGHRSSMEDSHTVELTLDSQSALLGVFDGHGGAECAQYCKRHAAEVLRNTPGWVAGDVARALKEAFLQLDQQMATACPSSSGTTCTMAVLQGHRLAVAGVGDSKCVLFHNKAGLGIDDNIHRSGHTSVSSSHGAGTGSGSEGGSTHGDNTSLSSCTSSCKARGQQQSHERELANRQQHRALSMTVDHKPDLPEEEERIRCAGGFVHQGRINCCLNVSRALGDAQFKQDAFRPASEQQVSPEPDIREAVINTTSDFLLLCSDGIWNSMKEKVVLRFVKQRLQRGQAPADVCRDLCKLCLEPCRSAYDNCTAILVTFKPPSVTQPHLMPHDGFPHSLPHNPYGQGSPRQHLHAQQHPHPATMQQQKQQQQQPEQMAVSGPASSSEGTSSEGGPIPSPPSRSSPDPMESPSLSPMGAASPYREDSPPGSTGSPAVPVLPCHKAVSSGSGGVAQGGGQEGKGSGAEIQRKHDADTDAVMRAAAASACTVAGQQQAEERQEAQKRSFGEQAGAAAVEVQQQQGRCGGNEGVAEAKVRQDTAMQQAN